MRHLKLFFFLTLSLSIFIGCSNEDEIADAKEEKIDAQSVTKPESTALLELLWETAGFLNPESVIYDKNHDVFYVSNVDGGPSDKDGKGSISKVSASGEILELNWVANLNAPKGLGLSPNGGLLYVTDINELVEIDIHSASVKNRFLIEDADFMNDVDVAANGTVYVSDMGKNRIYKMSNNQIETWLESDLLESPNGVYVEGDFLIVGTWGVMTDGFATEVPGHLIIINLADKKISDIGAGMPIGNLDGVESDGKDGYTVTDWLNGKLFYVDLEGKATKLLDLNQGSADHEYVHNKNLLLIPMMKDNVLKAYKYP